MKFENLINLSNDPSLAEELKQYGVVMNKADVPAILVEKARLQAEQAEQVVKAAAQEALEVDRLLEERIVVQVKQLRDLREQIENVKRNLAVINLAQKKAAEGNYQPAAILATLKQTDDFERQVMAAAVYRELVTELANSTETKPAVKRVARKRTTK